MKIVYPLTGKDKNELLNDLGKACDLYEWRADYYKEDKYEALRLLKEKAAKPIIYTDRDADIFEYVRMAETGFADIIDVDVKCAENVGFDTFVAELAKLPEKVKIMLSRHICDNDTDVAKELKALAEFDSGVIEQLNFLRKYSEVKTEKTALNSASKIIKLAVSPNSDEECDLQLSAAKKFREENPDVNLVFVAMGEKGRKSRSFMYAESELSYSSGRVATADGQYSLEEMISQKDSMDNIIEIKNVKFEYNKIDKERKLIALDDVSIDIARGSFVAIIGRNGSGKSTLAKNINALLLPSEGFVYVNGMDTKDGEKMWEIRKTAGMVFQNPDNQLVSSIVEDDVAFGPENLGVDPDEIRERVRISLDAVEMGKYSKRAPHMLSGGQKQRVAIAGVLAMHPQCIVFDEPTAMLDPKGREELLEVIEELHDKGITTVLITHFMDEAAKADRIIIMNDGKIAFDGEPKEVFMHAEEIKALDLNVPLAVEIASGLRSRGIDVPKEIITNEELCKYIVEKNGN